MEYTTHYNFKKPSLEDGADIQALNDNFDEADNILAAKADKATGATAGHIATFDENGNLQDSGTSIIPKSNNINVYVSKTGSDVDGDGSELNPFLSIKKASDYVKTIPKMLGDIVIQIDDGTYSEPSITFNHLAKQLHVRSKNSDRTKVTITIGGTFEARFGDVAFSALTMAGSQCVASYGPIVSVSSCILTASNWAISASLMGKVRATGNTFVNCNICITSSYGGIVSTENSSGSGNTIAFQSMGGILIHSGTTPTATTLESKTFGGQIFS